MSPIAASLRTPVGSPVFGSFTTTPLVGSGVFAVMPASLSAAVLAHAGVAVVTRHVRGPVGHEFVE